MVRALAAAVAISSFALAIACTPKTQPVTTADKGVAEKETWVALDGYGAKLRIPKGWTFERRESIIASVEQGERGAWFIAGTQTKEEAKQALTKGLKTLEIDLGEETSPRRDVIINGLTFARQDFDAARARNKPAHVVVLAADSVPNSKGFIVFIGYAHDDAIAVRADLQEAVKSLRPN
jgi:hypothetical protein